MSFHYFRPSFWPKPNLISKVWSYHDRNPLPPAVNLFFRNVTFIGRRIYFQLKAQKPAYIYGLDKSLDVAPRLRIVQPVVTASIGTKETYCRFKEVHRQNEHLHCTNGSWVPHPLVEFYGRGISIEEIALRIRGYLSAYKAVQNPLYLLRAKEACRYLTEKRIYPDGHIFLQGHLAIDLPYAFAGEALLCMYAFDRSNGTLLEHARKIGDRLIDYHVSGSVNHAVVPVQFLGQLYGVTGEKKYLKNCIKRLFRTAVPFQLPYGGWLGHESWLWYHALILRSLIIGYISVPNTLEYYAKKDRIACSIIAAVNRLLASQNKDGTFPLRPPEPLCEHRDEHRFIREKAVFTPGKTFEQITDNGIAYGSWNGYVIDALVTAYELLDMKEIIPCLNAFGRNIANTDYVWRLEFDTLGAGRLLEYSHVLLAEKKDVPASVHTAELIGENQ
jgi:hypothetical protein